MPDPIWMRIAGRGIGILLDLGARARYQINVRGLPNFTYSPSTIVAFNHRRDADSPIICSALFKRRALSSLDPMPVYVAREDLFRRGFLTAYLKSWPGPARKALSPLGVGPFLRTLRAYPVRRIAERTLGEVMEDVLAQFGDLPLDEVLRPEWCARFESLAPARGATLRLNQALDTRFRPLLSARYGLTKLTLGRFRELKPHERSTIESQLQLFVRVLEEGDTVFLAPEGAVSKDGSFARIRAGLHVLLNRPTTPVRVLPVGITYDFMTRGRQPVFVNVGPEMTDLRGLPPGEASARVARAILAQSTVTASQLASEPILAIRSRGGGLISRRRLLEHVASQAARWSDSGLFVDPRLLHTEELAQRVEDYVNYCVDSGELVRKDIENFWVPAPAKPVPAAWANPSGAFHYTRNELASFHAHLSVAQRSG